MTSSRVQTIPWFLTGRNIFLLGFLLFLSLTGSFLFLCYEHYESIKVQALKEDRASANLLSLLLEEHLEKVVKTMEAYASRPLLIQAIRKQDTTKATEHLAKLVATNPGIDSVVLTDKAANLWAIYPVRPEVIGMNLAHREWYQGVSREWKPYISNAMIRLVGEKDLAVHICVPIFDEQGEVIGILVNTQRTVTLSKIIERIPLDVGARSNVTDRKGYLIFSTRFAYDKELKLYPYYGVKSQITYPGDQSIPLPDPLEKGKTRYLSSSPIESCGWSVFISRDNHVLLKEGLHHYLQLGTTVLLIWVVAFGALLFLRNQILVRQIRERLQAERELFRSEERFRATFEQAAVGMALVGIDGRWLRVNQRLCEITGYPAEDLLTKTFQEITHPDDLDLDLDHVRRLLAGEFPDYSLEKRSLTRDGATVWANLTVGLVRDEQGAPDYFIAVIEDITERMEAEEKLRTLNEDLIRSNRELEQFAYIASHDLQEPLRMVSSYTQLLARRYGELLDQDAKDFIGFAVDGANRMQQLIQDLLAYSRITTRGKPPEPLDSHDALGEAVANLQATIQESGALVTTVDLPRVMGDRGQLVQVFQNLIANAVKFHRPEEPPRIHVSAERTGGFWTFRVADNGIGIESKYFDQVFQVFQRLHTRSEYPGTGIGLAICKRAIERFGGRIWVESEPGTGSTFFFTLPEVPDTKGDNK